MCLAQGPQCSDASEARTHGPSVSSQALSHWAPNVKHQNTPTHPHKVTYQRKNIEIARSSYKVKGKESYHIA